MKCSLGICNFLEEISSLSHSVVFLHFFALIAEEGFLISPCYSLELCIQMLISFLFFFAFCFSSFHSYFKASSDSHFAFFFFFFLYSREYRSTWNVTRTKEGFLYHNLSGTIWVYYIFLFSYVQFPSLSLDTYIHHFSVLFIYLFLPVLGLHWCVGFSLVGQAGATF